jgi:hypothetical protein
MHVYRYVACQHTYYISVLLLGADLIENIFPVFVFTKLLPGNALIKSVTRLPP